MGREMARLVKEMAQAGSPTPPHQLLLGPALALRESTGGTPAGRPTG
jgi:DNA-binding LacI/PurR family transcriptional regulator